MSRSVSRSLLYKIFVYSETFRKLLPKDGGQARLPPVSLPGPPIACRLAQSPVPSSDTT
jgi:hypothetical protein